MAKKTFILFIIISSVFIFSSFSFAANKTQSQVQKEFNAVKENLANTDATYEVAINPAAYRPMSDLAGFVIPKTPIIENENGIVASKSLPSSYDWRSNNGVTPIKDQGSCGSCWAFSTTGTFESAILIHDSKEEDLSEQSIVNCNNLNYGCNGGFFDAFDFYVNTGAALETCQPYVGYEGSCKSCERPYKIASWSYVGSGSSVPSVDQIKTAIYNYGPISAAVYVDTNFQYYSSGIFNTSGSGNANHAIMLVGWNDNGGNGYWILRNSWNTSWGEGGYMKIAYNTSSVGYAACYVDYNGSTPSETNTLKVTVNITHTYIGDLSVTLSTASSQTVTLHAQGDGGSADNIHQTYDITGWDGVYQGTWKLNVADHVGQDTGTLDSWSIEATPYGGSTHTASASDTPISIPDANSTGINSYINM